ncbi:hypothetical protein J7T55_000844 [Diaporthe amygdali]|uniref:uncharacterized protein n=1 Tax=Phomopsis amygdali TaxID=1214568 RepID=UPI0022FE46B9|nr:uncharacterized protein J7T55_000844 [Diaporthe amygdali]KAJ0119993.1 hypothetical protein J7T55_000844 [Diaporthe amygdali]
MANDVLRADAPRFAELISDAANDMSWAGAHVFAILSHAGMMLAGVICFMFSPASSDDIVRGRVPFGIASTLPSVTGMLGMMGAFLNFVLYQFLTQVNQPTALEFPRQLYHKRQSTILGGLLVLSVLCAGDLALAINLSIAARRYEQVSSAFWVIAVIATIAV